LRAIRDFPLVQWWIFRNPGRWPFGPWQNGLRPEMGRGGVGWKVALDPNLSCERQFGNKAM